MPDDLTPATIDIPEQEPEPNLDQPPVIPVATQVDKLAIARAAARANALAKHDVHNCLCPYCRGERKRQNIPNPPKPAVVRQPKAQASPSLTSPTPAVANVHPHADSAPIVHDRDKCPCTDCSEWRTDRARKAAEARYAKEAATSYDWESAPLSEAEQHLADMRREIEKGARALLQRFDTSKDKYVPCATCRKDIQNGLWVMQKNVKDAATGLNKNIFFCSAGCINMYQPNASQHGPTTGEPTGLHPEQSRNKAQTAIAAKATN
jgi:hypothetical protein